MNKHFILLFVLSVSALGFGQKYGWQAPDYKVIEKNITDKTSDYYYPNLLERFKALDTLMSPVQYEYLYYGYTLQKEYKPYGSFSKQDELMKYLNNELKEADYPKIINLLKEALEEYPFDLRAMNTLAYFYDKIGEQELTAKLDANFHNIIGVVLSSGDGKTCDKAFHVISVSHEYVLLSLFGLSSVAQSLVDTCDRMKLKANEYRLEELYFDVSKLLEKNKF